MIDVDKIYREDTTKDRLLMTINFQTPDGRLRSNRMKMTIKDGGLQIFINNGTTRDGIDKYAGIRLPKSDIQKVIAYLEKQLDLL